MAYQRTGRPSWYFEAKQAVGYRQLCTDTTDRRTAQKMEEAWATLADQRAWDILDPIVADLDKPKKQRTHTIGRLYDFWVETKQNIADVRRKVADTNIEPLVAEWYAIYQGQVESDSAKHALTHVRYIVPEGAVTLASAVTPDWLTTKLAEYPGAKTRGTRRKVHSSWSVFLEYLVQPKRLYAANPMLQVKRPALKKSPIAFYDAATVTRIIHWQESAERRAYMALVYGTGADVSPALLVTREDINPATKEVRIRGTKTSFRDRVARVNETLWPIFWKHAKMVAAGPVFPANWDRWTVSDWHRHAVRDGVKDTHGKVARAGLKLTPQLALRHARHHVAVRLLQAGTPIGVVAAQLGSDGRTVLKHYGPWIVSTDDRAKWERMAGEHEAQRQTANE